MTPAHGPQKVLIAYWFWSSTYDLQNLLFSGVPLCLGWNSHWVYTGATPKSKACDLQPVGRPSGAHLQHLPNSMDKVIANVCAEHVMGVGYSCDLKVTCHGRWLFMWFGGAAHVDIVACATTCVCQCVFCPTVLFRAIHWGPFVIVPIWKSSLNFFWR